MNPFQKGDILTTKPEYKAYLTDVYSLCYSKEKQMFGLAVAQGAPCKVAGYKDSQIWLTDLDETLQYDDYLRLNNKYFEAYMLPIPDDLL